MDRQPRLTDLIPRRWSTMGLIAVLGGAAVAGVELLYHLMPGLAAHIGALRIAAFDLASGRNLEPGSRPSCCNGRPWCHG